MQFEESIRTSATPEQVFAVYEDVLNWSSWDPDVQSSSIEGDFKLGAKGKLTPSNGPEVKIQITELTKNRSYTTVSKLILCSIFFEHECISSGDEITIIHRVVFVGFLSLFFGRIIGSGIKKGLPKAMQGLKNAAEGRKQ